MSCPALVTNLSTPKVMWYQDDLTVVVRVLLQDVEDYFLQVTCDNLMFSTTTNRNDYYLCLRLFGPVVAEKTTHANLGREIKIKLVKAHKWAEWLRLQFDRNKNNMIKPDPDHLFKNDWTSEPLSLMAEGTVDECKVRHNLVNIMPDVPSSDEEESDDEMMDRLFL